MVFQCILVPDGPLWPIFLSPSVIVAHICQTITFMAYIIPSVKVVVVLRSENSQQPQVTLWPRKVQVRWVSGRV